MLSFREKIKKLRKEKGWSQNEFAEKIGIHGRHVGKYEIGKVMPNAETIVRIAKAFDVSIDYLLMDNEHNNPSVSIRDRILLQQFEAIDKLDDKSKEVIKDLIDAYVKRGQMEQLLMDKKKKEVGSAKKKKELQEIAN